MTTSLAVDTTAPRAPMRLTRGGIDPALSSLAKRRALMLVQHRDAEVSGR